MFVHTISIKYLDSYVLVTRSVSRLKINDKQLYFRIFRYFPTLTVVLKLYKLYVLLYAPIGTEIYFFFGTAKIINKCSNSLNFHGTNFCIENVVHLLINI